MENLKAYQSLKTIDKIISIITKKERGAYLRFGDGDLNIMQGLSEQLNTYNINFSNELKESICIDETNYLKGICLMCKKYGLLEDKMWPGNHEWPENRVNHFYNVIYNIRKKHLTDYYSFVAFNYYITTYPEKSLPLMKNIRDLCLQNEVIFVGNNMINKDIINLFFGQKYNFIECPSRNSYNEINIIENKLIKNLNSNNNYKILVICSGVTTRCLIKRIWINKNIKSKYFLLDFGSIIDALSGLITRQYIIDTKFNSIKYCSDFKNYLEDK